MIDEIVIAVPRHSISDLLKQEELGFINYDLDGSYQLLLDSYVKINRLVAETDETFKQLIPYVLVRNEQKYLLLKRKNTQTEVRLHNKMSLGVGGHINPEDISASNDIIISGLIRELEEEIKVKKYRISNLLGFINDDSSEVGRVHIGLLFEIECLSSKIQIIEDDKMEGTWASIDEIQENYEYLETWSKIAFDNYITTPSRNNPNH